MRVNHIRICQICGIQTKRLSSHIKCKHNITAQQYYDIYLKQEKEGICPVCNKPTKFHGITHGYSTCCSLKCANNYSVEKIKQSKLEKYGSTTYNNSAKARQTCIERYGVDNVLKLPDIHKKGVEKAHSTTSNKKRAKTCLYKYGAENIWSSEYGKQHIKKTNLDKYGVEYITQSSEIKEKIKQTNLAKYGVVSNLNITEVKQKLSTTETQTKRANSLKNKPKYSKLEKYFESQLNFLGYKKNIDYFTQYRSDEYPFMCDFYLIKNHTYIEINGYWMHGGHCFDKNNPNDLVILNKWIKKAEHSSQYKYAIHIWTKSDPEKRRYGQKLNYIELWNINDIDNFIYKLKEDI